MFGGKYTANLEFSTSITEFIIKPTNNKNPTEPIIEKDIKRFLMNFINPRFGFAFSPQIKFIESWISTKTPEAPINKIITPKMVAKVELCDSWIFR